MSLLHKLAEPPCDMEYVRLRTREEDGCWLWAGAAKDGRWPVVAFRRLDTEGIKRDFILYVRHVVFWIKSGRRPSFGGGRALSLTCNNERCVNPAHLKAMTFSEIQKRRNSTQPLIARIKTAHARRKDSKLSDDAVQEIRFSELPRKELAAMHGITYEYVRQLQKGEWRKQYTANPFAGLGA